jgi:hypothetical protein
VIGCDSVLPRVVHRALVIFFIFFPFLSECGIGCGSVLPRVVHRALFKDNADGNCCSGMRRVLSVA